jgi:predicted AlkP superfamily pyrophosphatase or phosphodiesterase
VYLPHLDYNLQRYGPKHPTIATDAATVDGIIGDLLDFFKGRSVQIVLLSEYGISAVDTPVHLNRLFRSQGWISLKDELGRELLDYGASKVFAVADHQIAHIYCNDTSLTDSVCKLLEKQSGIGEVLDGPAKRSRGLDHARAGDLIVVAAEGAWFTYYYWQDDRVAPDFARTVDIHRKPGYDPVELFLDPARRFVKGRIAWRLLQKRVGLRMLMDVVPLDASLVKGSHGCKPDSEQEWPLFITSRSDLISKPIVESTAVFELLRKHII